MIKMAHTRHPRPRYEGDPSMEDYVSLRMSRADALDLVRHVLADGLIKPDAYTTWQPRIGGKALDGSRIDGYLALFVQDPLTCNACGADVEPGTGRIVLQSLCCAKCGPILDAAVNAARSAR